MSRPRLRRALAAAGLAGLLATVAAAPAAVAQAPFADADFDAFATGSAVHASGLTQGSVADGGTRVVNADVAFSGAAASSAGLSGTRSNEMGVLVQPDQGGKNTYGRGSGLELGGGVEVPDATNQAILAAKAEAAAPPSSDTVTEEAGPIPAAPAAYASLLRGQADANWATDMCPTDTDLSYGLGYVADAQLLDQTGTGDDDDDLEQPVVASDAPDPERRVSQTVSRSYLAPQTDAEGNQVGDAYGLTAEVRETIAPVTFFKDTPNEFTVEVLGEWVLQANATGVPGSANVHYGPADTSPSTPVVRVIQDGEVQGQLTTQDVFGEEGLVVDVGDGAGTSLARIAVGEDPRPINGSADEDVTIAADGTSVSAAVDVVRVELLTAAGVGQAAEVRIGHMEAEATVPAGGIDCAQAGIPVSKAATAQEVDPGDQFSYVITVENPFECTLSGVEVVDTITTDEGVTYEVVGSEPEGQVADDGTVTVDVGDIAPGESAEVRLDVKVAEDSAAGLFHDTAVATGHCDARPVEGTTSLDGPQVVAPDAGPTTIDSTPAGSTPSLPRTGGGFALLGLAAMGAAGAMWRLKH